MTNIREVSGAKGTVFDLPHAMSLSDDDCNVLLVSSRTLFFIQQFGTGEIDFISRYASSFLPGDRYVLAQTAANLDDINNLGNRYELEVQPVTCDIVDAINGVQSAILTAGSNACACGTVGETLETTSGTPGGIPPEGFGEPDPSVVDRLCKAANAVHASILAAITALEASPVEGYLNLGFGVVAGLVSAIIAAAFIPVVGLLIVGVAGAIISATLALLVAGVNLTSLLAALIANRDDLICALTEATSATDARTNYKAVLTAAGQSAQNTALIGAILTNNVLDLLWFSTSDSEAFLDTYVPPYDCAGCTWEHTFDFTIDAQGWTNDAIGGRPFGVYSPGVGWVSVWAVLAALWDERLFLRLEGPFVGTTITYVETEYQIVGTCGAASGMVLGAMPGYDPSAGRGPLTCPDPAMIDNGAGSNASPTHFESQMNGNAAVDGQVDFTLIRVTVQGTGINPW